MSVDSNEIDKILAEPDEVIPVAIDNIVEAVNDILEPGPPYLFTTLENTYYIAGDNICGQVLLDLPKRLKKCTLSLSCQGCEEVHVFLQNNPVSQYTNKIFSLNSELKSWRRLSEGGYIVPFQFKLPQHCPPSFYYSGSNEENFYLKAQISYTMVAKFTYRKMQEELIHSRVLNIRSIECRNNPKVEAEAIEFVHGFCCSSSKGSSVFKLVHTAEEHPTANGPISFKLVPDNGNCSVPINQVVAEITMELELVGRERSYLLNQTIKSIPRITWIAAYTSLVFEKDFEFTSDLKISGEDLNVSTINTQYIKCRYVVKVHVHYDMGLKKIPACVRLNIHVNPSMPMEKHKNSLPADWTGESEPVVKLVPENI